MSGVFGLLDVFDESNELDWPVVIDMTSMTVIKEHHVVTDTDILPKRVGEFEPQTTGISKESSRGKIREPDRISDLQGLTSQRLG